MMYRQAVNKVDSVLLIVILILGAFSVYAFVRPAPSATATATSTVTSTGVSSQSASAALKVVKVAHSVRNQSDLLPMYIAEDLGLFRQEGLVVEGESAVLPGDTGTTALLSGDVQFTINGDPILIPALKGANITILSYWFVGPSYGYVVAKPGITALSQLNGKTIASERPGSATYVWVNQILNYYHINATQVPFDSSALRVAAFLAGKVDSAAISPNLIPKLGSGYNILVRGGGPVAGYPSEYVATTPSMITSNPQVVLAFQRAIMRAIAIVLTFPNATLPVIMRHYNMTRVQAEVYYSETLPQYTNNVSLSLIQARANELVPLNKITNPLPVSRFVDTSFYNRVASSGL